MKINMYANDLKSAIKRISGAVDGKSQFFGYVTFVADGNILAVRAITAKTKTEIRIADVTIIESGCATVSIDDLKRMSLKGDMVMITTSDGKFSVGNDVKSYKMADSYCEDFSFKLPTFRPEEITCIYADYAESFLKNLAGINATRLEKSSSRVMEGFYLDAGNGRIATIDGHRLAVADIVENTLHLAEAAFTNGILPGEVYKILNSVAADGKIEVSFTPDGKHAYMVGDDFTILTTLVDGSFFDIEGLLAENYDYQVSIETDSMLPVAKEYKQYIGKDKIYDLKYPMVISCHNGSIMAGIRDERCQVIDKICDVSGIDDFFFAINPVFVIDALSAGKNDNFLMCGKYSHKMPVTIRTGKFKFVLLPININTNDSLLVDIIARQDK